MTYILKLLRDGDELTSVEINADQAVEFMAWGPARQTADVPEPITPTPEQSAPQTGRRRSKCSICGKVGHNVMTCPNGKGLHPNNPKGPRTGEQSGTKPKRTPKPCCGSLQIRHKKNCQADVQSFEESESRQPPTQPMSEAQFTDLKEAVASGNFQDSKSYARDNDIPLKEVNAAIGSQSFRTYLFNRRKPTE